MPFLSRKTPRASRYDYQNQGMYFVTICTKERFHYFGKIVDKQMILSDIGKICDEQLALMLHKRPGIDIHEYVIMPNHVHVLLRMDDRRDKGLPCPIHDNTNRTLQTNIPLAIITNQSLGTVIGGRKSAVSKKCGEGGLVFAWQSRYHDIIVRDQQAYEKIIYYIRTNPEKRTEDTHYTE